MSVTDKRGLRADDSAMARDLDRVLGDEIDPSHEVEGLVRHDAARHQGGKEAQGEEKRPGRGSPRSAKRVASPNRHAVVGAGPPQRSAPSERSPPLLYSS